MSRNCCHDVIVTRKKYMIAMPTEPPSNVFLNPIDMKLTMETNIAPLICIRKASHRLALFAKKYTCN